MFVMLWTRVNHGIGFNYMAFEKRVTGMWVCVPSQFVLNLYFSQVLNMCYTRINTGTVQSLSIWTTVAVEANRRPSCKRALTCSSAALIPPHPGACQGFLAEVYPSCRRLDRTPAAAVVSRRRYRSGCRHTISNPSSYRQQVVPVSIRMPW